MRVVAGTRAAVLAPRDRIKSSLNTGRYVHTDSQIRACGAAFARCLELRLACRGPHGQFPFRADEMAGVAVRDSFQIVLVLEFRLPEISRWRHLGDDLPRPKPGRLDVRDGVLGNMLLLFTDIENGGAI